MKYLSILMFLFSGLISNMSQASCVLEECPPCYTKDQGPYLGIIVGLNSFELKHSQVHFYPGYYIGGSLGYKFSNPIRIEGEVAYQRSNVKSTQLNSNIKLNNICGHIRSWSYMVNLLMDCDIGLPVIPYFGNGIGYAEAKGHWSGNYTSISREPCMFQPNPKKHVTYTSRINGIAWQAIVGVKFHIYQGIEACLDYRYFLFTHTGQTHKVGLNLTRYF